MEQSFFDKVKEFFGFKEVEEEKPFEISQEPETAAPKRPSLKGFKGALINTTSSKQFPQNEIKIEEPRIYEDSLNISMHLRENKPCIVNLKYLDTDSGKRLIDFVCGTAYAINGHMMKIGENIFLFTPPNVLIDNAEEKTTFEQGMQEEEKEDFFRNVSGT